MKMRASFISFVALTAAIASAAMTTPTKQKAPFTITIAAAQQNFKAGNPIRIHVTLTNTSDTVIWLQRSPSAEQAESHYYVVVQDKTGKDATETRYGTAARTRKLYGSEMTKPIEPGEKMEEDTILGKQFDLSTPGDYTIQLARPASEGHQDEAVKSNKITVSIVP